MNFDDMTRRVAADLDARYADYDLSAARARLEDGVLREATQPSAFGPVDMPGGGWRLQAACRDESPDMPYARGAEQRKAKLLCLTCPVRTDCLVEALDYRIDFGVWGGMTERERRALLRRRPDVVSWRELLEPDRAWEYYGMEIS